MRRIPPGLTLLLLAPVLGELVSAHQTPLEFVNPLNFLILSLPYGFGAVLCRELVVRWCKGWPSLLLLAVAYGIYEEGIVVRSFFNPDWAELGALAGYSTFAGVNWIWAELLVHFHVLVSIGASVLLAEILYPERRHESWVGNKALIACLVGLLLWLPLGLLMTSYRPPSGWYGLSWLALLGLGWLARILPARPLAPAGRRVAAPWVFFMLGLVNMSAFFFTAFLTAEAGRPPLFVTVTSLLLLDVVSLYLALRWSDNGHGWDDRHRLALVAGLLGFFVYFCFDHDLEQFRGTSLVGLATILALWRLSRTVARRVRSSGPGSQVRARADAG